MSIRASRETFIFQQLSHKSFKAYLKPLPTTFPLTMIRNTASRVAKWMKRKKLEAAAEEVEHLRERFSNDLFCVAKFIHNLEWATNHHKDTKKSSGKFKGF